MFIFWKSFWVYLLHKNFPDLRLQYLPIKMGLGLVSSFIFFSFILYMFGNDFTRELA